MIKITTSDIIPINKSINGRIYTETVIHKALEKIDFPLKCEDLTVDSMWIENNKVFANITIDNESLVELVERGKK